MTGWEFFRPTGAKLVFLAEWTALILERGIAVPLLRSNP